MSKYRLILECYLSGQMPEDKWIEHLKDEVFRKWLEKIGYVLEYPYSTPDFSGEI